MWVDYFDWSPLFLRRFEMKDLAQIRAVYPEAFQYRQEKSIGQQRHVEYKLTVEATADEKISPAGVGQSTALMKRREHFQRRLTKIVMKHHQVSNHLSFSA